jgi:hypothetical protein
VLQVAQASQKLSSEPVVIGVLDLWNGVLEVMLEIVGVVAPDGVSCSQKEDADSKQSLLSSDHIIVHCTQGHHCEPPEEVLSCHHFIENNEEPSLQEEGQKEVIVKHNSSCDHYGPLRHKSQDAEDDGGGLIEELVDHIEVDGVIVPVVFPYKVVEERLPQELPSVNGVEKCSESNESTSGGSCEHQPVSREKTLFTPNRSNRLTSSQETSVSINEEVEDKAVNNGVDFEVDTQPVEEPREDKLSF